MKACRIILPLLLGIVLTLPSLTARSASGLGQLDRERGVLTMAPLLAKVTPAVVSVSVTARTAQFDNPLLRDPFFRRFFGVPDSPQSREAQSAGSGVIVDARRGYVLTNHHVIDKAHEVSVTLQDGRVLAARVVGSDPETDIAVLELPPENLTSAAFADSDQLLVGDVVFAIGNPFGLGQTVTSGIISALGRGIGMHGFEDFIQTDAAINPGNSGGALINSKGELIGINTAIIGPAGGNVGIGFAVPTNMARSVMEQLIRHGEVRRGRIGVLIQDLTRELAKALAVGVEEGAVISRVERDSPAERAGLQAGDVVVAVDGAPVRNSGDLRNRVGLMELGKELSLAFYRDGERRRTRLRISQVQTDALAGDVAAPQLAGAEFSEIPSAHPAHGHVDGILITRIEPGSPAWRAGLRNNDIVLAVNRQGIATLAEFRQALAETRGVIALNLLRGNTQLFVVLR